MGFFTEFPTESKDDYEMIAAKAKDKLNAKRIYFPKNQQPPYYDATISGENYRFEINDKGRNVKAIYNENNEVVYESTEAELDEWLSQRYSMTPAIKDGSKKIREVTGSEYAVFQGLMKGHEFLVKSEDKLYTVGYSQDGEDVKYILHNDIYIYERE